MADKSEISETLKCEKSRHLENKSGNFPKNLKSEIFKKNLEVFETKSKSEKISNILKI